MCQESLKCNTSVFLFPAQGPACNRRVLSSVRYFSLPNGRRPMNARDGITLFAQGPTYRAVCAPCTMSADATERSSRCALVAMMNGRWSLWSLVDPIREHVPSMRGDAIGSLCV